MLNYKKYISNYIMNFPSWGSERKLVIIESDDWGSVRMPSAETYQKCLSAGYQVDKSPYTKYDSLESEKDLEELFNVLLSFKDMNGNHPVITANVLTANPDFRRIRNSGCKEYFYENVKDTFERYPDHTRCFELWQKGFKSAIFHPQSHGREHLNVSRWMKDLQSDTPEAVFSLETEMPGIFNRSSNKGGNQYVVAFEVSSQADLLQKKIILKEGLALFRQIMGYDSLSFVSPNYLLPISMEEDLADCGVKYVQGSRFQFYPSGDYKVIKKKFRYTGKKSNTGLIFMARNASFEPSLNQQLDVVNDCLARIELAFKMNKPAIIGTHRLNFIGSIDPDNRSNNLFLFKELLNNILKNWPSAEFISSPNLGNLINKKYENRNTLQ
jgi:hypothetical protein